MADIELVIKIPEKVYNYVQHLGSIDMIDTQQVANAIFDGIPLPKGHGDLIDKFEILRFLKCPKYENCDWKNCSDCNQSRCININNVNRLMTILKADKESENKK